MFLATKGRPIAGRLISEFKRIDESPGFDNREAASLAGVIDSERLVTLARETGRMAEYLSHHLDEADGRASASPDTPLLDALARGVREGRIPRAQAIGIAIILFGAGGESTAALLGSTLRALAEQPALADQLRDEPALIPRFVEEIVPASGVGPDRYELQMLYGVPRMKLLNRMVERGVVSRLYVPFALSWPMAVAYLRRRLDEYPAMMLLVLKNLLSRR